MKKYLILTPSISNMGGSEMFTANKSKYLREHGWGVNVFYFNTRGEVMIPELEKYKGNCIPELLLRIEHFTKIYRNKIISRIIEGINDDDQVVIESHLFNLGIWGELIAQRIGAKNILNFMEENIGEVSKNEADFMEWKLKRWEILNASDKSFHRYFNSRYKEEYKQYTHNFMRVYCSNVTTNKEVDVSFISPADYTILSIGRLDKPYILPSIKEVITFAKENAVKTINLIVVGGSPDGNSEKKIDIFCNPIDNLRVYQFGYMFPVPSNIIQLADVAFSSANSISVSANQGIPTVGIDIHDTLPLGVYGKTTQNKFSRDDEPVIALSQWLHQILVDKKYVKESPILEDDKESNEVFGKQIDFLSLSPSDRRTYDVENMYSLPTYILFNIKRHIHSLIGI